MKRAFAAWVLLLASCAQGATTSGGDPGDGGVVILDDSGQPVEGGVVCGAALCPARPNAVVACGDAGACTIGQCLGNHADCNHDSTDGCEIDLDADPANCGMCAKPCNPVTNG